MKSQEDKGMAGEYSLRVEYGVCFSYAWSAGH